MLWEAIEAFAFDGAASPDGRGGSTAAKPSSAAMQIVTRQLQKAMLHSIEAEDLFQMTVLKISRHAQRYPDTPSPKSPAAYFTATCANAAKDIQKSEIAAGGFDALAVSLDGEFMGGLVDDEDSEPRLGPEELDVARAIIERRGEVERTVSAALTWLTLSSSSPRSLPIEVPTPTRGGADAAVRWAALFYATQRPALFNDSPNNTNKRNNYLRQVDALIDEMARRIPGAGR